MYRSRERMCVKEVVSVMTGELHFTPIHGSFIISSWTFYWTVTIRDLFNKSTNQPVHINENVRFYLRAAELVELFYAFGYLHSAFRNHKSINYLDQRSWLSVVFEVVSVFSFIINFVSSLTKLNLTKFN